MALKAARGHSSWVRSLSEQSVCSQVGKRVNGKVEGVQLQVSLLSERNLPLELSDVISWASLGEYDPWTLKPVITIDGRVFYIPHPPSLSSFAFESNVSVHLVGL